MTRTGIVFGVGNIVILAFYLIPLTELLISYLPFLVLAAGGVAKMTLGPNGYENLPLQIPSDSMACVGNCINKAMSALIPVVFWVHVVETLAILAIWYFVSTVVGLTGLFPIVFLVWNAVFICGKFEKEIYQAAGPQIAKAKAVAADAWAKIPRHAAAAKPAPAPASPVQAKKSE